MGCAGAAWGFVGAAVLAQWPIGSFLRPDPGEALRLALCLPAALGWLGLTALAAVGLPSGGPLLAPGVAGFGLGLASGAALVAWLRRGV